MNTLKYILDKYKLNGNQRQQPVEIPNTTRLELAQLFCELGFKKGAEIGVEEGIYSEVLLKENPQLHLDSIDAWAAYEGYRDHMTQKEMDDIYAKAYEKLKPYQDRNVLIKGFSVEVSEMYPDEYFDFVYLDANHEFTHIVNDIAAWERKVKVEGIIAGHDYIKRRTNSYLMHVPMAIHGYIEAYQIKPLFVLGRKEQRPEEKRESTRSWFYVKPPRDPMLPGHNQKPLDNK